MTEKPLLGVTGITCHAWNADGTRVALSPNSSEVYIYDTAGSEDYTTWKKLYELKEHSELVSGIDWSPVTNQIVTCGHDRNAYVWDFDAASNSWKPKLVLLRIQRAATHVKWSPNGKKFAVASGAKWVPVCHYEEKNDWWVSKAIKKHKSTVLSVAWAPNNLFLVTGSSDNKCRIFSAFMKEVDSTEDDGFGAVFPNQHKFGEVLAEFDQAGSWVHGVAWAPSGFRVAFSGHNSSVNFVQLYAGASPHVTTVRLAQLPLHDIQFLSDKALVGGGWDCSPVLITASGDDAAPTWSVGPELEKKDERKAEAKQSGFAAARNIFQTSVTKGVQLGDQKEEVALKSHHQNIITSVCSYKRVTFSTAALDGRVFFWNLPKLGVDVASLNIQ